MIAAHLSELPAPLSQRRPDVPSALAEVVMRCLEKDPAHRPQSADDLIVALDRMNTPTHDRTGWRRLGIIAASVSAIAVMALTAWVATHRIGSVSSSKAIAVLPFESVGGDTANAYFAEGMADELATALTKVAGIKVKGRHSALAFKGNHAAAQELGRALGVGAILEGTVRQEGDRMRVSAQLTSTADGEVLWRETYQRAVTGVFAVQDEITHAIVGALRVTLVGGDRATVNVGNAGTTNLEAYQLYLRGMYFYRRRRVDKAIDNFQAAIASDSTFARAHAWLGLSWSTSTLVGGAPISATFPRAIAEADRALALDSSTAEAYVAVGLAHLWSHHWDRADDAFRRALALDPNLAIGRLWYSWLLSATGRMREAMTEIELAKALDPLDAATVAVEARTFSSGGRNAEAIAEARRAVELDSTLGFAQMNLLIALVDGGQAPEARMRAERSSNPLAGFAAYAIGRGGDPTRAAVLAREMVPQQDAAVLMRAWFGAGDTAQALSELERMVETGDANLISTPLTGHIYDPVRGSPRFVAVVRRLGLKPELFTASRRQ
jgi:serine/threonine-protein kinase